MTFRSMIGHGDLATALPALVALIALRLRFRGAIYVPAPLVSSVLIVIQLLGTGRSFE